MLKEEEDNGDERNALRRKSAVTNGVRIVQSFACVSLIEYVFTFILLYITVLLSRCEPRTNENQRHEKWERERRKASSIRVSFVALIHISICLMYLRASHIFNVFAHSSLDMPLTHIDTTNHRYCCCGCLVSSSLRFFEPRILSYL